MSALAVTLTANADNSVTLAWDRHETHGPEITFQVLWGRESRNYTESGDAGTNLTYRVRDLPSGVTNYFAAVAKDPYSGLVSDYSNEVIYVAPRLGPELTIQKTLLSSVVLTVKGKAGESVVIEASQYPTGPWTPVFEGVMPASGELTFVDATSFSSRFYRAVLQYRSK